MKVKNHIDVSRLIGKIDNDFNISESDWIPRVAAWCIDALGQMKCLPYEKKCRKLEVKDREAYYPCPINMKEIKVFDSRGCEVEPAKEDCCHKCNSELGANSSQVSNSEIAIIDVTNKSGVNFMEVAQILQGNAGRNFVIQGQCIDLNFDTDYITVEALEVATYYDEYYDCEVPYIYDNALLLEALAWYVLFKYLSRGSKHPVYSLTSPSPVTNPYIQWNTLRVRAAAAVRNEMFKADGWRNFFYNSTFDPRNS